MRTAQTQRCWKHLEFPHNQSIAEHGWNHKATEGCVMVWYLFNICEASRMEGFENWEVWDSSLESFHGFGWREDFLPAWVHENNNILACCWWDSKPGVPEEAGDARPERGCWQSTPHTQQNLLWGWAEGVTCRLNYREWIPWVFWSRNVCSRLIPPLDLGYCLFPLQFSFSTVITAGSVTHLLALVPCPRPVHIVVQAAILGGWWWLTRKQSWGVPSNGRTVKCCKHRF